MWTNRTGKWYMYHQFIIIIISIPNRSSVCYHTIVTRILQQTINLLIHYIYYLFHQMVSDVQTKAFYRCIWCWMTRVRSVVMSRLSCAILYAGVMRNRLAITMSKLRHNVDLPLSRGFVECIKVNCCKQHQQPLKCTDCQTGSVEQAWKSVHWIQYVCLYSPNKRFRFKEMMLMWYYFTKFLWKPQHKQLINTKHSVVSLHLVRTRWRILGLQCYPGCKI